MITIKQMYKKGSKVRHRTSNLEGHISETTHGYSVNGMYINESNRAIHFHTLSTTLEELKKDWKRIYKFKYRNQ